MSVGAVVRLTSKDQSFSREAVPGDNGEFSFPKVPPGHFTLSVNSAGFGDQAFSGELAPGQTYLVPAIVLSVATVVTTVDVKEPLDPVELATEQVKEQEQQRMLRFIPNFYVTYRDDAAPLTTKLKFQLAWKSSTDPVTLLALPSSRDYSRPVTSTQNLGKARRAMASASARLTRVIITSTFLSGAVFPSLLKQDPRYFYKGTGSTGSRILRAVGNSVVCKGDNGRWQTNYSNIAGIFGGAAVSSTYYPARKQAAVILSNSLIRLGESSLAGIFQEFIARKLTKPPKGQALADSESSQAPSTQSKPGSLASPPCITYQSVDDLSRIRPVSRSSPSRPTDVPIGKQHAHRGNQFISCTCSQSGAYCVT